MILAIEKKKKERNRIEQNGTEWNSPSLSFLSSQSLPNHTTTIMLGIDPQPLIVNLRHNHPDAQPNKSIKHLNDTKHFVALGIQENLSMKQISHHSIPH